MITTDNLSIGSVRDGISFSLPKDGCLGVIGLNGAGKSTLLALLAGVIRPQGGAMVVPRGV